MKKFLSIILSVITIFSACSLASSAASADGKNSITYQDSEFTFSGYLTDTPVTVETPENGVYQYFRIRSDKAGIYKVSFELEYTSEFYYHIGEYCSNSNFDSVLSAESGDECSFCCYFRMKDNEETYLLIENNCPVMVSSEYEGEVTNVSYTAPVTRGSSSFDREEYWSSYTLYYSVDFENGDSFRDRCGFGEPFNINNVSTIKATIDFLGETYIFNVPVIDITDIISSITLPEDFEPSYFSLDTDSNDIYWYTTPGYVTINYTDGTSQQAEPYEKVKIAQLGDSEYYVYTEYKDGKYCVEVAGFTAEFDTVKPTEYIPQIIVYVCWRLYKNVRSGFKANINNIKYKFRDAVNSIMSDYNNLRVLLQIIIYELKAS